MSSSGSSVLHGVNPTFFLKKDSVSFSLLFPFYSHANVELDSYHI